MLDSLSDKVLNRALDVIQSKEFQEQMLPVADQLFERYKAKVFNSIGGSMKGANYSMQGGFNPLDLVGKGGKPNWLGLLGMVIGGQKREESSSKLP